MKRWIIAIIIATAVIFAAHTAAGDAGTTGTRVQFYEPTGNFILILPDSDMSRLRESVATGEKYFTYGTLAVNLDDTPLIDAQRSSWG